MASNKMLIDASHREETRVVVLRGNQIDEFDFESQNKRQLKGNIYLAKVTRVEPSLQAAFVDYGGNRHGFLAFNEIHPDYYQIPVADRQALLAEDAADAKRDRDAEEDENSAPGADQDNDRDEQSDAISAEVEAESEEEVKPARKNRRPRRKTAAKKTEIDDKAQESAQESEDATANESDAPPEDSGNDENEDPKSIAAIIETDSISEPAPDKDDAADDKADESLSSDDDKPVSRSRATRRPRKSAKTETDAAPDEVAAKTNSDETSNAEENSSSDNSDDDTASPAADKTDDGESARKPRRKRKPTRSRAKKNNTSNTRNEDNDDEQGVDVAGQEDAMEEVPPRRRSRRQYKIQEVIKRRQVLLVQVVKEERGNKGAALTTYLSLAGRYSVLMPNTARGGGISRKITNAADRKRLKAIASGLEVPEGMGVILRTAGASRENAEIERDFEYLMRLWESVRAMTLSSSAPCLVYEEGSLIKRSIRDLYGKNTGEVIVAGERGHAEAREFMEMLMPSHTDKVKLYRDEQAMFARFGVEQQLDKMLSQQVTLKSGGYLVIDQTEALVAIDVNSGRATREHSIEETALQTNLETAEEVARQLRLRDLAGLIVIDFIDMEENRNNRAVEKKLKECLKHDRARIQVGRISHFGLLEMSRQRMRASVLDSTMDICPHCQGKGHIRSNSSVSLHILRSIEEHLLKNSRFDITVKAPADVSLYMLNHQRQALMEVENRFGVKIYLEGSRELLGENFTIEKGEASTGERKPLTHIKAGDMSEEINTSTNTSVDEEDEAPAKRKRGRRRTRSKKEAAPNQELDTDVSEDDQVTAESTPESDDKPAKRKRTRGKRGGRKTNKAANDQEQSTNSDAEPVLDENAPVDAAAGENTQDTPAPRKRNSRPRKKKVETGSSARESDETSNAAEPQQAEVAATTPKAKRRNTKRKPKDPAPSGETESSDGMDTQVADGADKNSGDKKGSWWSRNGFFT